MRYAIRSLRRNAGFAFGVLLILIVGIGTNTVIFSVIKAVLLTPLPYPELDRPGDALAARFAEGTQP